MEDRPLITRVVLENYKSIPFCDVKLGPLSLVVGPNGAGKSNFLDALRFLSKLMYAPLADAVQERGGYEKLRFRRRHVDRKLGIRVEFSIHDSRGYYSLQLDQDASGVYFFAGEGGAIDKLSLKGIGQPNSPEPYPQLLGNRPFARVLNFIRSFRFYKFDAAMLRPPVESGSTDVLLTDGRNLPNVMKRIEDHYPSVLERITQYLQAINPSIRSVSVRELPGYRTLYFQTYGAATGFDSSQMSDGTLTSLAILVALFQRQAGAAVGLIGLEEPEGALHPAAAAVLFDAMREASESLEVIATTHSADLLDNENIETESILALEMDNGSTRAGPIDQTGSEALKKRLFTAGELMRMNHLRPEIPDLTESQIESVLFDPLVPA